MAGRLVSAGADTGGIAAAGDAYRNGDVLVAQPSLFDPTRAPEGKHTLSIFSQYAPYELAEGTWVLMVGPAWRRDAGIQPGDVVATIFHSLGFNLEQHLPGPAGRPFPLVDFGVHEIKELF